ncbi:hypothetical protein [Paenibacillus sp. L3-i20]|uniref:hypothetical protein n=1 Tax=Paenibacillus sp. L3-i20 TaxID=2905833 RepID=UPI001EDD0A72|nr:hypothetical protein [Paenibacillus sp. L3-i20]GKU76955.1 hypothetical protein L3i20_v213520 [Paenibacillus sp. L3-i20]
MNSNLGWNMSLKGARKWTAAAIIFAIFMSSISGVAHAAEPAVTGIELGYSSLDYNTNTQSLEMLVDDDKVNVTVYASTVGSSQNKNVTAEATWKSSNSSIIKVENGVLTGLGKGTSTISVSYKGFTTSIKASSDFEYDKVTLMQGNIEAPAIIEDIKLGNPLSFSLNGFKGSTPKTITTEALWTSSNTSVATVEEGKVTLVGVGTTTITAKYKGKSDSIKITTSSPYKKIIIGPAPPNELLELEVDAPKYNLHATTENKTGEPTSTVTDVATWTSSNTKVLTVEKGVLTPLAAGKATITVSHLGVTTTLEAVVRTPYQSIKLLPEKEYHMQLQDAQFQITAEVLNINNSIEPITDKAEWSSSDVTIVTVDKGVIKPRSVGTAKITVSHKGVSRSIDITVYPSITKLKAEEDTLDGFKGISGELPKITATTFDGSTVDVTKLTKWTTADGSIADIENNKWVAKKLGQTTLTANVQGVKVDVKAIVHTKPVKLIAEAKDMSIVIGKATALPKVTVVNEDGEEVDVSESVKWKTTSDNIILLEKTMKGLEASSVALTGTYLTKSVSVRIKVEEEIVKLVAEPTNIQLNPGRSKTIKVTGHYKNGKTISVGSKMTWVVGNTAIASVSGSSTVKALNVGLTKLIGTYQGKSIEVFVEVTPKLKSLQLSTKSIVLPVKGTYVTTLKAYYYTGSPVDQTNIAEWSSSKTTVATVTDGRITAVGKGTATIKATFEGRSVSLRVTVK